MELLAWWNLIFLLPGSIGVILAFLSVIGAGEGHDAHADVDADVDVDADLHVDMDADIDAHVDLDHDVDHHIDTDIHSEGFFESTLALLGVGRVPVMLLMTMLCLFFSIIGFGMNQILKDLMPVWGFFPISLGVGLLSGLVFSGALARLMARFLPKEETYATTFDSLAGQSGKVVLLSSPTEGYIQIQDQFGNFQELHCLSLEGKPLSKDQPVIIARVDTKERICYVINDETSDELVAEKKRTPLLTEHKTSS